MRFAIIYNRCKMPEKHLHKWKGVSYGRIIRKNKD